MSLDYDSPKHIFQEWVKYNENKYGSNWKKIVSEQLVEDLKKSPLYKQLQEKLCQPSNHQDSLPMNSQNKNTNLPQS